MTSNNKTNRTVGKNMDRIMELLSKLRFYGMLETYRNDCRTTSSDGMTMMSSLNGFWKVSMITDAM